MEKTCSSLEQLSVLQSSVSTHTSQFRGSPQLSGIFPKVLITLAFKLRAHFVWNKYSWHPLPCLRQLEQIQASEEANRSFQLLLPPAPAHLTISVKFALLRCSPHPLSEVGVYLPLLLCCLCSKDFLGPRVSHFPKAHIASKSQLATLHQKQIRAQMPLYAIPVRSRMRLATGCEAPSPSGTVLCLQRYSSLNDHQHLTLNLGSCKSLHL